MQCMHACQLNSPFENTQKSECRCSVSRAGREVSLSTVSMQGYIRWFKACFLGGRDPLSPLRPKPT